MNKEKKTLLKLENAGFSKNNKWLVKGVSLEVRQGEIVTLIGPNGSGKTTTAKIALGIYKEIEGKVNSFHSKFEFRFRYYLFDKCTCNPIDINIVVW